MKKLIILFTFLFAFANISAQKEKLDQLFERYQETEGVTSIKIAKPMFNMLNKLNINDSELDQIKPLLSKINGLRILVVEKPEAETVADGKSLLFHNLQADINSSIKNMKYEELMTVNSKDNKIKFLSADATNDILDNLLLSINSEDNTVLMMLDGKISMDDVNKLINETQNAATKSTLVTENISKDGVTQVRNVGKFSGIKASNGIKVNFTQGNNQSVVVETDSDLQKYVVTEVQNGILVLKIDNRDQKKLNFKKLLVSVEAPQLSLVGLNSGAQLSTLNTIKENSFKADLSSGANLTAEVDARQSVAIDITSGSSARLAVNTSRFSFSGTSGSNATITGKTDAASFDLTSAATCNAQNLVSREAMVSATSGSNLKINAAQSLGGSVTSGASVKYQGNATSTVKTSSGGSIKTL